MDLNSGDPAYEFVDIKTLAEEDKDKKKIQEVRPLKNAGKIYSGDFRNLLLLQMLNSLGRHYDVFPSW